MKKRADGRYQIKVTLPNGKVKFVYGRTKKEVRAKRDALRLTYSLGATNMDSTVTLSDWANVWWESVKEGRTGHSSQQGYISAMNNYILPALGEMRLVEIKPIHVQDMINDMGSRGLSKSLQGKILITLNGMFEYAIRNGLLIGNPAQYVEYYDVPVRKREALTSPEIEELLEVAKGTRAELAIHLALYCGLRRGEIVALKWSDIDMDKQVVNITKSVEFIGNQPVEKEPKSKAGIRTIPIPPRLFTLLKKEAKKSIFVVPSAKDVQMSEAAVRRLIEPAQRAVSFKLGWHILRHTYATLLEQLGISPKMCQYLLGHAELSTTKDIYTHIQEENILAASIKLQEIHQAGE